MSLVDIFNKENAIDLYPCLGHVSGGAVETWFLPEAPKNANRCWTGHWQPGITGIADGGISSLKWTLI